MITLVDFYADWCGPCIAMKPIFEKIQKDFEGKVEFKTIDVEEDHETSAEHGVMSIPTFIIFENDKEIDRKVGAMPEQMLVDWLNSHVK